MTSLAIVSALTLLLAVALPCLAHHVDHLARLHTQAAMSPLGGPGNVQKGTP